MWLKIFSSLWLSLQVFFKLLQSLSQQKEEDEGKLEQNADNEKIIEGEVDEANNIRAGSGQLDDNLLLEPAERGAGGLPCVPADLCGDEGGSCEDRKAAGGGENQGAQSDMGKQLPASGFGLPKRAVSKVFIHCSASDRPEDDNVATINQWHIARGWAEIGYNYYIDKQGRIWTGRDIEKIPAAQYGHNTGSIAICCGGKNSFSAAQFLNLQEFCRTIAAVFLKVGVKVTFHGHCEVSTKTCPDFDYKSVLGLDGKGNLSS